MKRCNKERISITIDPELNRKLENLMLKLDRRKSWLVNKAIKHLITNNREVVGSNLPINLRQNKYL